MTRECSTVRDDAAERLRETTIESEHIYRGRIVTLRIDEVRLPGEGRSRREVVEHPGAVAAVALTDAGEVLLVRQWRHPVEEVLIEVPAGTLEEGELPEATLARELAEEIGQQPRKVEHLGDIYVSPGYSDEVISLYLATDLVPASAEADADENIEVVRIPFDEAVARCHAGEIRDSKTVAALLLAASRTGS